MVVRMRVKERLISLVWILCSRIPHWARRAICAAAPWPISLLPLPGLRRWETNVEQALGRRPSSLERRELVASWIRNNLMSLSLSRWSDRDVLQRAIVSDLDVVKLRDSLSGPGLVLVLPHMGSWDFAGAWCTRVGIKVVSVAERLPSGVYELFRDARAGMGMDILPVGEPDLMRKLVASVRRREAVCLLSDRDFSGRGISATWPGAELSVSVPSGPALLSRLTGCHMRVVTTRFCGDSVELLIGDVIDVASPAVMMGEVVRQFAAAVEETPTSWLMLHRIFRDG